jgi:hypothetical protein
MERSITPVFVGHTSFAKDRTSLLNPEYDLSCGINLISKTSFLQAAWIIQNAKCLIGMDNGLCHLGAMTSLPAMVMGFTTCTVEHSYPRSRNLKLFPIHPDPKVLSCTFCQSQIRNVRNLDFKYCIYGDDACTKILPASAWTDALEEVFR